MRRRVGGRGGGERYEEAGSGLGYLFGDRWAHGHAQQASGGGRVGSPARNDSLTGAAKPSRGGVPSKQTNCWWTPPRWWGSRGPVGRGGGSSPGRGWAKARRVSAGGGIPTWSVHGEEWRVPTLLQADDTRHVLPWCGRGQGWVGGRGEPTLSSTAADGKSRCPLPPSLLPSRALRSLSSGPSPSLFPPSSLPLISRLAPSNLFGD